MHSFPDMRRTRVLRGHTSGVFTLAFDRQQRWMASGGADAVACLWDTQVRPLGGRVGGLKSGCLAAATNARALRSLHCQSPWLTVLSRLPARGRTGSASAPSPPWTTPSAR